METFTTPKIVTNMRCSCDGIGESNEEVLAFILYNINTQDPEHFYPTPPTVDYGTAVPCYAIIFRTTEQSPYHRQLFHPPQCILNPYPFMHILYFPIIS